MPAPLSDRAPIVDGTGRPQRTFIRYLQELFNGTIPRTSYTFAQLNNMTPSGLVTAFCSDSSVTTLAAPLAGGGASLVPVYWDGSAWRVG